MLCTLPSALWAQEAWTPLPGDVDAMVTDGVLLKSPVKLGYTLVSETKVPSTNPTHPDNIVQTYDVPFDVLLGYLTKMADARKEVAIVDPAFYPEAEGLSYRILNIQDVDGMKRILFTNQNASRDITLLLQPAGNQTQVIYENVVRTHVHSGLMPWRADFQGFTLSKPLAFDWN